MPEPLAAKAMNLPFKVCPRCGAEHVHEALICADCGVALEIAGTLQPSPKPLPRVSELQRVAAGGPWEMERLALELQNAGISSRIDALAPSPPTDGPGSRPSHRGSAGAGTRLALYVLPEEAGVAERVIRQVLLPRESDAVEHPPSGAELDVCPACGAAISEDATACTDCGLAFISAEDG